MAWTYRMHRVHELVSARRRKRRVGLAVAAVSVATMHAWTVAFAADNVFPMVLTDRSCQVVTRDTATQQTGCDPDAPTSTQSDSSPRQVVIAQNVSAPGAMTVASQEQNAPISQFP